MCKIQALVKDRRYHYIETGSLISIKKNVKNIRIPSEETRIDMLPMDYEEFRWALGDTATLPLLQKAFAARLSLTDGVNKKLMRDFRTYMLVGGMPQAVETFLDTKNLSLVDQTKREILDLYEDDFRKIDPSGNHLYEVDFLTSKGTKINPIEVKSSGYKAHKSLDKFCGKFHERIGDIYLAYGKDLRAEGKMTLVPMYMVPFLTK